MVEPVTLGAIAAALLAKALTRAEDGAVDAGVEVVRRAVQALSSRFSREEDEEAEKAVERLAEAPDSLSREQALAELLDKRIDDSAGLRAELEALVADAKDAGMDIGSITQVAEGESIVQIAGVDASEVNVHQNPPPRPRP